MKQLSSVILSVSFLIPIFPLAASAACSPVALGGTGNCTFTVSDVLFGNGTSPIATSSAFTFNTALSKLTVTNASTTRLSITSLATPAGSFLAIDPNGLVIATSTPSAGTGTVTNIATTFPVLGGPITTTGTISWGGLSTTSSAVQSSLLYFSNNTNGVANVATTTQTFSGPFKLSAVQGALVGGTSATITWTGLATTSQPSSSNLLVSNGGAGVFGVATNTVSCSSGVSCTSFTAISGSPISITNTGGTVTSVTGTWPILSTGGATPVISWGGLSTSTIPVANQVAFWSAATTLAGNSAFTFNAAGNTLLTVTNASTTNLAASQSLFVASNKIVGKQDKSAAIASSTIAYFGASASASSTMTIWNPVQAITITDLYCKTEGGTGTLYIDIGSGTATTTVQCKNSGGSTSGLSISIATRGNVFLSAGNVSGTYTDFVPTLSFTIQ